MTDAAAEATPEPPSLRHLSANARQLSRMLYMEDIVQQRNATVDQQLKLVNAASDAARAAQKKRLRHRLADLEKVLELERENGELSSRLMEAEREKLTLKYYISEEHVSRIHKYIEASELLTNRARRELLERDAQLRRTQQVLLCARGQLGNLPEVLAHPGAGVPCGCELDGRWDELKKAMETKEEEVAYLQHLLREQKEEMEAKGSGGEAPSAGQGRRKPRKGEELGDEVLPDKTPGEEGALGERGAPGGGGVRHGRGPEQGTL